MLLHAIQDVLGDTSGIWGIWLGFKYRRIKLSCMVENMTKLPRSKSANLTVRSYCLKPIMYVTLIYPYIARKTQATSSSARHVLQKPMRFLQRRRRCFSLGRADDACLVMEFNTCVASIHGRVQAATRYVGPLALMEIEQRGPPSVELSSDSYEKHNHRCPAQQQQCPPAVDLLSALLALASLLQAVLHRLLRVIQQRRPLPQLPLHRQRVALHARRHAHQLIRQHVLR